MQFRSESNSTYTIQAREQKSRSQQKDVVKPLHKYCIWLDVEIGI